MPMLIVVSAVSCGIAIVCLALYVFLVATRPKPAMPPTEGERAGAVRPHGEFLDPAKTIDAFSKLTDSLDKAGPLIASLVGAMFFLLVAVLAAWLDSRSASANAPTPSGNQETKAALDQLTVRIDGLEKRLNESTSGEIAKLTAQIEAQNATFNKHMMELNDSTSAAAIIKSLLSIGDGRGACAISLSFGGATGARSEGRSPPCCNAAAPCCCRPPPASPCRPEDRSKCP